MINISSTVREFSPLAYDRLLFYDENGDPNPWLAESWEETPNSVTYTLKDGITCQDGSDFTASTVAANFEFVEDEANASPLRGTLVPVGITTEADDEARTVTISSDDPGSFLLYQTGTLDMLCQAALDDPDSIANATNGTGMFQLTDALPGDQYTLERRDTYTWGYDDTTADTPGLPKTVVVRMIDNESTLANLLLSKEVNAGRVNGPDAERLDSAGLETVSSELISGEYWFNQSEGRIAVDPAVREAIVTAVDLDDLAAVYTGGRGQRATSALSLLPRPCVYESTGSLPAGDLDAANKLLDDAGWVMGSDGVRAKDGTPLALTLLYVNTTDGAKAAAEIAVEQWTQLGADITLDGGDEAYVIGKATGEDRGAWDISWLSLETELPGPMVPFVSGPTAPDGLNLVGVDHPGYMEEVAIASAEQGADSCPAWQAAEEALIDDFYVVPFATDNDTVHYNGATTTAAVLFPPGAALRVLK